MKTKMIIGALMAVLLTTVFVGFPTEAAVKRDTVARANFKQMFEDRFETGIKEFEELKEEDDERVRGLDNLEVSYSEIGNGLYDIRIDAELTRGVDATFHIIYDAIDEKDVDDYGVFEGERMDTDELIGMFPEVKGL